MVGVLFRLYKSVAISLLLWIVAWVVQTVWKTVRGHVTIKCAVLVLWCGLSSAAIAADYAQDHAVDSAVTPSVVISPQRDAASRSDFVSPEIASELEPLGLQQAAWQQAHSVVIALLLALCVLAIITVALRIVNKLSERRSARARLPLDHAAPLQSFSPSPIRTSTPMAHDPNGEQSTALPHEIKAITPNALPLDAALDPAQPLPIDSAADRVAIPASASSPNPFSAPPSIPRQRGDATATTVLSATWQLFATSQQGQGHLAKSPRIPCQDGHALRVIDAAWGVAVVCDGAGSQPYSQLGASFVAHEIAAHLADGIPNTQIYKNRQLPSDDAWRLYCKALVLQTRKKLEAWIDAEAIADPALHGVSVRDVGCTLIWLVYTPMGLLTGHVGDGRAGYLDADGWQAMMTPWEGEYSNQTVFINSDFIYVDQLENPADPAKPYLETRVIVSDTLKAFVLMSDGCEHGLYETVGYDPVSNTNININKPHAGVCDNIIQLLTEPVSRANAEDAERLFSEIVDHGNSALIQEGDDKTLLLGFLTMPEDRLAQDIDGNTSPDQKSGNP